MDSEMKGESLMMEGWRKKGVTWSIEAWSCESLDFIDFHHANEFEREIEWMKESFLLILLSTLHFL